MNIKAELHIERDNGDDGFIQIYKVGHYRVDVRGWPNSISDSIFVHIRCEHDDRNKKSYLPWLYVDDDLEGGFRSSDVLVGTTSYGTLPLDEIERFMVEMREGIETAKYISKTFIEPMMAGTWYWHVSD